MEILQKNISIEPFLSRLSGTSPTVTEWESGETCNWGKIVRDFIVDDDLVLDLKDSLPLSYGLTSGDSGYTETYWVLRYRTLINNLTWLRNFLLDSRLFEICYRDERENLVDVTDKFDILNLDNLLGILSGKTLNMYTMGPLIITEWVVEIETESGVTYSQWDSDGKYVTYETEGAEQVYRVQYLGEEYYTKVIDDIIGDYIWIHPDYETFLKTFSPIENDAVDGLFHANALFKFANEKIYGGIDESATTIPYANINLEITQDIDSVGNFTSVAEYWIANKKYYINDIVIYGEDDVNMYKLIRGEKLEFIDVPTQLYTTIKGDIESGSEVYVIYVDGDTDVYGDTAHIYVRETVNGYQFVVPYYTGKYDAYTKTTLFDSSEGEHWALLSCAAEDSGDTVEFIGESKLESLKRIKRSYDDDNNLLPFIVTYDDSGTPLQNGELLYVINSPMESEAGRYSFIDEIIVGDSSFTEGVVTYEEGMPESGEITFVYYIGSWLGEDNLPDKNTGLKYTDVYDYTIESIDTVFNGSSMTFNYINIIYDNTIPYEEITSDSTAIYSRIEMQGSDKENNFLCSNYIMQDELLGFEDVKKDFSDYVIERGSSAAFERHLVLGEISTFDDLESYKNGFFVLKDNENS